jgi:NAD(P)-dependent dehydrogenase (short-subunit alcohol dehydrogenase family)
VDQRGEPKVPVLTGLALITGASSGIGRAFAVRLGAEGYNLVVVGRRRDRLEEIAAALPYVQVRVLVAELGSDAGVEAVAEVCAAEHLTVLVNCAGVAHYMPFVELPAGKANELVHVKVVAPTLLARAAAPGMVARGEGTIINVAGMLAFSGQRRSKNFRFGAPSTSPRSPTWSLCHKSCTRSSSPTECGYRRCARESSQRNSTNGRGWTSAQYRECPRKT